MRCMKILYDTNVYSCTSVSVDKIITHSTALFDSKILFIFDQFVRLKFCIIFTKIHIAIYQKFSALNRLVLKLCNF